MIAAQTAMKAVDPITTDGAQLFYNGSEYLQLPSSWREITTQPLFTELLNIIHERGVIAGGREMASVLRISSQPTEAAATGATDGLHSHPTRREGKSPNPHVAHAALATAIEDGGETYPGAVPTSLPMDTTPRGHGCEAERLEG